MQGSLLLQAALKLLPPYNHSLLLRCVWNGFSVLGEAFIHFLSLEAMGSDHLLSLAKNPVYSRVIDAALESETVPEFMKRKLILSLRPCFFELAQDKFGSRVAERCWFHSDLFCRVYECTLLMLSTDFSLSGKDCRHSGRIRRKAVAFILWQIFLKDI
jgi:nucleolar protein 9